MLGQARQHNFGLVEHRPVSTEAYLSELFPVGSAFSDGNGPYLTIRLEHHRRLLTYLDDGGGPSLRLELDRFLEQIDAPCFAYGVPN